MLRYPKNKILYITMEATEDCDIDIKLTHNKKEAPEMVVASAKNSQPILNTTSQSAMNRSFASSDSDASPRGSPRGSPNRAGGAGLQGSPSMTVNTLQLMLGTEENTQHAAKLYNNVKKKIKYMVYEDLDVAKDFLNLVENLKMFKAKENMELRKTILDAHPEAEFDQEQPVLVVEGFQNFFQQDLFKMMKEGHITKA